MTSEAGLIVRSLARHRAIVLLIVVQMAVACAVLTSGMSLVSQRYALLDVPSGLAERHLTVMNVETLQETLDTAQRQELVAHLAALPMVESAAYVNSLPFTGRISDFRMGRPGQTQGRQDSTLYYGSRGFTRVLGVEILTGRDFLGEDFSDGNAGPLGSAGALILSQSLANRLSAGVGSQVEVAGRTSTVVGIARDVMAPVLIDAESAANTAFLPAPPSGAENFRIVVRSTGEATSDLAKTLVSTATRSTPSAFVWSAKPFESLRSGYFDPDLKVVRLVFGLGLLVATVVACGVGGLSSHWIFARRKHIMIRRYLGAREADIRRYFHLENLMITTCGAVVGLAAAVVLNQGLSRWGGLPPLPLGPLSLGALAMVAIGQLAILVPVHRAVRGLYRPS